MARITLTNPVSQQSIDKADVVEIQIRRHGGSLSLDIVYAEGYISGGKFEAKNSRRETIPEASAIAILQATASGAKTIEGNLVDAILQWLVDNQKIAGTVA